MFLTPVDASWLQLAQGPDLEGEDKAFRRRLCRSTGIVLKLNDFESNFPSSNKFGGNQRGRKYPQLILLNLQHVNSWNYVETMLMPWGSLHVHVTREVLGATGSSNLQFTMGAGYVPSWHGHESKLPGAWTHTGLNSLLMSPTLPGGFVTQDCRIIYHHVIINQHEISDHVSYQNICFQ